MVPVGIGGTNEELDLPHISFMSAILPLESDLIGMIGSRRKSKALMQ